MTATFINPGILVSLRTSVRGGLSYDRLDLETTPDGTTTRWETTKHVIDPAERKLAEQTRSKMSGQITRTCTPTSFGLLCPEDNEEALDAAITQAHEMAAEFNARALHSRVDVYVLKGRVGANDTEAIAALIDEARNLIEQMNAGFAEADINKVRDAASRARRVKALFTNGASKSIDAALTAAREVATAVTKKVRDTGIEAELVMNYVDREQFDKARFAFIDLIQPADVAPLPVANLQRMSELDTNEAI